jgi:hypothetical protein
MAPQRLSRILLAALLAAASVPPTVADDRAREEIRRLERDLEDQRERARERQERIERGRDPGAELRSLERRQRSLERRFAPEGAGSTRRKGLSDDIRRLERQPGGGPEGRDRARQRALEESARGERPPPMRAPFPERRRQPGDSRGSDLITPGIPETGLDLEDLGPPDGGG